MPGPVSGLSATSKKNKKKLAKKLKMQILQTQPQMKKKKISWACDAIQRKALFHIWMLHFAVQLYVLYPFLFWYLKSELLSSV